MDVTFKDSQGNEIACELWDAGKQSSEIELLRTVASYLGVKWGKDEFGWWASVEKAKINNWSVWRQDDHGNKYEIETKLTENNAQELVKNLESSDHKQTYWAEKTEP